jgi:hypothetical protein
MKTGKGRRWGAAIFGGEEGEEVRRLYGTEGRQHNKEWRDGLGGRRRRLTSGCRRLPKKIRSVDRMRGWVKLLTGLTKKYD